MKGLLKKLTNERAKSADVLKREVGTVTAVNGEKVTVMLGESSVTVPNKTIEDISVGDEVTVCYWTNLANGWIEVRHGESNLSARRLLVENAVITTQVYHGADKGYYIATNDELIAEYPDEANPILVNGVWVASTSDASKCDYDVNVSMNILDTETNSVKETIIASVLSGFGSSRGYSSARNVTASKIGSAGDKTGAVYYAIYYGKYYSFTGKKPYLRFVHTAINEPDDNFTYGSVDITLYGVQKYTGKEDTVTEVTSFTAGFASENEYKCAIITTTKFEVV